MLQNAYHYLFTFSLFFLAFLILCGLIRAIRGPRISDRVVAINMISTLVIAMICILAVLKGEGYLVDVALIYSLLGFLAVVVLCKVFLGIANQRKQTEQAIKVEKTENKQPAPIQVQKNAEAMNDRKLQAEKPARSVRRSEGTPAPTENAASETISYFSPAEAASWKQDATKLNDLLNQMSTNGKESE